MSPTKETKEKIMNAALELFSHRGYKGTTTRSVAEKAKISEVTLFRYFGTKQELFYTVIDRETDVTENLLAVSTEPSEDMVADLTCIGQYMIENMIARAKFTKILMIEASRDLSIFFEHASSAPFGILAKLSEYFMNAQHMGLVRDIDPDLAAITFFSFFFRSFVVHAFLGEDVFMHMNEQSIKKFVELFVNGIVKRG